MLNSFLESASRETRLTIMEKEGGAGHVVSGKMRSKKSNTEESTTAHYEQKSDHKKTTCQFIVFGSPETNIVTPRS